MKTCYQTRTYLTRELISSGHPDVETALREAKKLHKSGSFVVEKVDYARSEEGYWEVIKVERMN